MSIVQKIALSIMVVSFIFSAILGLAIKGCDIEDDNKSKKTFSRGFTYCFLTFVSSLIVFVLGFIW